MKKIQSSEKPNKVIKHEILKYFALKSKESDILKFSRSQKGRSGNIKKSKELALTQSTIQTHDNDFVNVRAKTIIKRKNPKYLTEIQPKMLKRSICKFYIVPNEIYGLISEWFTYTFTECSIFNGSGIKNNERVIHISNIKQFFLDGFLISRNIFNEFIGPLKACTWINLQSLVFAIENMQPKLGLRNVFGYTNIDVLVKKRVYVMLFFFILVQSYEKYPLSIEDLELVCSISLKGSSGEDLKQFVRNVFRKVSSFSVAFEEFFEYTLTFYN